MKMNKNLVRIIAAPLASAGMAAGALGLAAAANADTVADIWSPHTGPALAAHFSNNAGQSAETHTADAPS